MYPLQRDGQELDPATRVLQAWYPRVFEMLQQCFRTQVDDTGRRPRRHLTTEKSQIFLPRGLTMESADIITSPTGKVQNYITICSSVSDRTSLRIRSRDAKTLQPNHLKFGQPKNMLENQSGFIQIKKPTMHIDNNAHVYNRKSTYTAVFIKLVCQDP